MKFHSIRWFFTHILSNITCLAFQVIDPVVPRYTAVEAEGTVPVLVNGASVEPLTVAKHPKNDTIGTKTVWVGPRILIDGVDAETLKEGENTTFINWGNLLIKKINW